MDEREPSLLSQKRELLKRRKQLLDIKLQLQKDVHIAQPINFGRKFATLSEAKVLSIADRLHHRFSDVRFLQPLECHMLCGLKVVDYNKSKLVVQFRPSYLDKILQKVYAIYLLAGDNGYSVEKYYLPHLVQMKPLVQRWSPLRRDNLKNFLLDIKQQVNAFHHRQNQILELKEMAKSQKLTLKVFHPLSLNYVIITTSMVDKQKHKGFKSLNLILNYDSNCYLPTTLNIECSEMKEEDLAVAQEQFSALKKLTLKEAFEICYIKTERYSLSMQEDVPNETLNEEVSDSSSVSEEEGNLSDVSTESAPKRLKSFRTRSKVNKENRLSPILEAARKSKSKRLTKGKKNKNTGNSSSAEEEEDISGVSTSDAPGMSADSQLQPGTKRRVESALQKGKISKSKYSTKETRQVASKGESSTVQTKKHLNTLSRKAPKKNYAPDDASDGFLRDRKKKSPHDPSTSKATKEVPTVDQTNKITRYLSRNKR